MKFIGQQGLFAIEIVKFDLDVEWLAKRIIFRRAKVLWLHFMFCLIANFV